MERRSLDCLGGREAEEAQRREARDPWLLLECKPQERMNRGKGQRASTGQAMPRQAGELW